MMLAVNRRDFIRVSALTAAGTLAAACTVATPATPPAAPPEAPTAPATAAPAAPTAAPAATYSEAPMLAELVAKGELPPVEERLPENPYVAVGLDGIGKYGGTMRKSFNGMADHASMTHMNNRGLININQDMEIHPMMADSWEISPDATTYTFHLRKGLKWSDGAPLTVEDFRFYYEDTILNREYTKVQPEWLASVIEGERVPATFSTPDDLTVQYTFAQPKALFYYWGSIILGIPALPAHYLKPFHPAYADKATLDKAVADAQLDDWTELFTKKVDKVNNVELPTHEPWLQQNVWSDEFVTAVRNPYFWEVDTEGNQLPYIDKATFRLFNDAQVNVMWAANGEIDSQRRHFSFSRDYTTLKESEKSGDYTVLLWRATKTLCAYFNMTTKNQRLRELFMERDFRIAMSICANREEMIELLYDGYGTPQQYAPPKDSPFYYEKLSNAYLEYDVDGANALLDGLGYTERDAEGYRLYKDGSKERISITAIGTSKDADSTVLMLIDYLKGVGLQLSYRGVDRALSIETHQSNEVECSIGEADRNLIPLGDPRHWMKHGTTDSRGVCIAWSAYYLDPTNPIAEKPPEGHWIWDIWAAWEELQRTVGEEAQQEVFWRVLDIWARELPCPGYFGETPEIVVIKNGFKGLHDGYATDCCTSGYEYIIDNATWYWDEPEKHTS